MRYSNNIYAIANSNYMIFFVIYILISSQLSVVVSLLEQML